MANTLQAKNNCWPQKPATWCTRGWPSVCSGGLIMVSISVFFFFLTGLRFCIYIRYMGTAKESPRVKEIRVRIQSTEVWPPPSQRLAQIFSCFLYKVQHRSCSSLFQHLKFHHGLYPGRSLRLKCGEPGCSSVFYKYYGFKKHILRVHRDCVASGTAENVGSGINVSDALSEDPPVTFQTPVENRQLTDMCSVIVAGV